MWRCRVGYYVDESKVWERESVWENVGGYKMLEIQTRDTSKHQARFHLQESYHLVKRQCFYHHIPNYANLSELTSL